MIYSKLICLYPKPPKNMEEKKSYSYSRKKHTFSSSYLLFSMYVACNYAYAEVYVPLYIYTFMYINTQP